ncbi:hypothetical protein GGI35DRAFT_332348 [Trichoderma velutinum]
MIRAIFTTFSFLATSISTQLKPSGISAGGCVQASRANRRCSNDFSLRKQLCGLDDELFLFLISSSHFVFFAFIHFGSFF